MHDDIKLLRQALAAGPTPGPWQHLGNGDLHAGTEADRTAVDLASVYLRTTGEHDASADYIAAASPDRVQRLLDEIERLRAQVERASPRWIPVSERLPKHFGDVLVALDTGSVCLGMLLWPDQIGSTWDWTSSDDADDDAAVTHWMPWPAAPGDAA